MNENEQLQNEQETKAGEWDDLIKYYQKTTCRTENLINEYNLKINANGG